MLFGAIGTLPFGIPATLTLRHTAIHAATWLRVGYIVIFPTAIFGGLAVVLWAERRREGPLAVPVTE